MPPAAVQCNRVGLKRRVIPEEVRKAMVFTWLERWRLDHYELEKQSQPRACEGALKLDPCRGPGSLWIDACQDRRKENP